MTDDQSTAVDTATDPTDVVTEEVAVEDVVVEDLLVEEVSIDGMCGVY